MIASELESPNSPSQKAFQCRICLKGFASSLKADHHEHKEHGQPRKVSLDIGSAVRARQPNNPFVFSQGDDAKKQDGADETTAAPGPDSSNSSTSPTKLQGDVDILSGLPKMSDQMMAEYGLTPSVFEDGFRSTLCAVNPLTEALRSQGGPQVSNKRKAGLSPRILNPAPRPTGASAPNVSVPPSTEETSDSAGFPPAASGQPTQPFNPMAFVSLPKSPGAFFYTHVTPDGMFVSSPILPLSPQQLLPMLNGANGMGNPFMFSVPSSPSTLQPLHSQPFAQTGGGLIATSHLAENGYHSGFPFAMQAQALPPVYDPQLMELQAMWASPYPTDLRDSVTPMSEASTIHSDKPKKRGRKQKVDELLSENSDSVSIISSEISASVSSAHKRSRPILDTDDPVLSDKRRRNRVAAEKCRLKRKARQVSLEEQNDILTEKIRNMEKRHQELAATSQEVVNRLQKENASLRVENTALRKLLPVQSTMTTNTKVEQFPVILKSNPG